MNISASSPGRCEAETVCANRKNSFGRGNRRAEAPNGNRDPFREPRVALVRTDVLARERGNRCTRHRLLAEGKHFRAPGKIAPSTRNGCSVRSGRENDDALNTTQTRCMEPPTCCALSHDGHFMYVAGMGNKWHIFLFADCKALELEGSF